MLLRVSLVAFLALPELNKLGGRLELSEGVPI
jgi:hypothetical protein